VRWALGLALAAAIWPATASATATFLVTNMDAPGEGFNDPTPVSPVGGNPGTTVGQQRLNAFNEATRIWGKTIDSTVPIVIYASFAPLDCSGGRITLGQASSAGLVANRPGLPPNVLYPLALANRIAGQDLDSTSEDIDAMFNGSLYDCSAGQQDWYYGFDGKPPADDIDLISVLLHELGHGLGFASAVDNESGALGGGQLDMVDTFTAHLYDNQTGQLWSAMTDAQRATSAQNVRHLVWQGDNVTKAAAKVLAKGAPRLTFAPAINGLGGALSEADFGPYLSAGSVHGPVVLGTPVDGCALPPSYTGKVVLFQGGDCPSSQKSQLAQMGGAIAVLIADVNGGYGIEPPFSLDDPPSQVAMFPVHIPVIGVTYADAVLVSGASNEMVTLDADATRLVGTDAQGQMYMYATRPLLEGSTVSHWDTLARPDLMQEPNASYTVSHDLRMEQALMRDIGWTPFCGNGKPDTGEQCDNGTANSDTAPNACRTDCTTAHCGDGVVDTGEACDSGTANSDTMPGACRVACVQPRCGDSVVDPGEQCDSGAANSDTTAGACRTTCMSARCGDGVVDPGEQCDNGAANAAGAPCGTDCHLPGQSTGGAGGGVGGIGAGGNGGGGGTGGGNSGGCSCSVGSNGAPAGVALTAVLALAGLLVRRRRRRPIRARA
jgi:MYXO-CTERM domain-containing protein